MKGGGLADNKIKKNGRSSQNLTETVKIDRYSKALIEY